MKKYSYIILLMIGIGLCVGFTTPMNDRVPLNCDQKLKWSKTDIKKKHLIYNGDKGDHIKVLLIDLTQYSIIPLVNKSFVRKDKIDISINNYLEESTRHFCISIMTKEHHFFKEVEILD